MLNSLYYRFNAWRYGNSYGCGRCHHGHMFHEHSGSFRKDCTVKGCPCKAYSIERTMSAEALSMKGKKFNPLPAAVRASIVEFPDGCTTHTFQAMNLRYAFCLGYKAGQAAIRKRRQSQSDASAEAGK